MNIQYNQEHEIQGISIQPTDFNFNQSITDLIEILNENQFYNCFKLGERLVIGKINAFDIVSFPTNKITCIAVTNDEICVDTDTFSLSISNNESKFSTYLFY